MKSRKRVLTADDPRHGTSAGYVAHHAHSVPMCEPCRRARQDVRGDYRPCLHCGQNTTSKKRTCRVCLSVKRNEDRNEDRSDTYSDDDALTGGQWVGRGGIMRWVAAA